MLLVLKREGSEWIVSLWESIMKPPNALVPEIGDMIFLPHNQFDVEKRRDLFRHYLRLRKLS